MTENVKHTPGPWRVEEDTTLVWGNCSFGDDGTLNEVGKPVAEAQGERGWARTGRDRMPEGEREANARLIAAAPDLLEALQYVMSAHGEQLTDAFAQANAAIAKATGA